MSEHIYNDFRQRYSGTYLKARIKGVDDFYYISEAGQDEVITPTSTKFQIVLQNSQEENVLARFCDIQFDYELPRSKLIDMPEGVWFVAQRADRQWKRGICSQTYNVDMPDRVMYTEMTETLSYDYDWPKGIGNIFSGSGSPRRIAWMAITKQLYSQQYPSYLDVHRELDGLTRMSKAFSPHYFLSLSVIDDGFTWWRDCLPIAQVSRKNPLKIDCFENGLFRQEILDFLNKKGFHNVEIR